MTAATAAPVSRQTPAWLPGSILMAVISAVAYVLADVETRILGQPVIEALVLALLIGVAARNVLGDGSKPYAPGASLVAKHVLEVGVAFIGVSVYMPDILKAGPALLGLVLGGVGAGIVLSFTVGRLMGLNPHLAALVAIGNSICGNSAIAALAPVIGAEKKDVASAIGLTAVIGVLLVLGLPLLIAPFLLSNYQYGVLAGMSVYAVPQVVAAAFPVSELSGNVATLVKLSRVLLLGPAVVIIGLAFRVWGGKTGGASTKLSTYVPWFVATFLVLAAVRSLDVMPMALVDPAKQVSRLLTMLAMAGLGFGVDIRSVRTVGPRVGVAVVLSLTFLASVTIAWLKLGGIDG
ncbi:MAG: putative sulfate exporter family transporter [Chloroflexi bacterium]|jgi:uncharacterized integral membrane protein (TIGR00698 family)|nr:putative sulfate exporter family transporter [Chloroflexota bacterium]